MPNISLKYKVGDLVSHRHINYGLGIIIEKRESISFGEFMEMYVVHFPLENIRRLIYWSELEKHDTARRCC